MICFSILLLLATSSPHDKLYRLPARSSLVAHAQKISDHASQLLAMPMPQTSCENEIAVSRIDHEADRAFYAAMNLVNLAAIHRDMGTEPDRKIVLEAIRKTIKQAVNAIEGSLTVMDQNLVLLKVSTRSLDDAASVFRDGQVAAAQRVRDDVRELAGLLDSE